jgi:hypothetical protein
VRSGGGRRGEAGGADVREKQIWEGGALRESRTGVVDDQIWQGWKNRTVRFAKPEYPVLTVSEQNQGAKLEDLKIQVVLKREKGLKGIKGAR